MKASIKMVVYRRFLLSFVLFFFVPVLILFLIGSLVVFPQYKKNFQNTADNACQRAVENANIIFKGFDNTIQEILGDYTIFQYKVNDSICNTLVVEKRLRSFMNTNPYIKKIYYYYPQNQQLVSHQNAIDIGQTNYLPSDIVPLADFLMNEVPKKKEDGLGQLQFENIGNLSMMYKQNAADRSAIIIMMDKEAILTNILSALSMKDSTIKIDTYFGLPILENNLHQNEKALILQDYLLESGLLRLSLLIPEKSIYGMYPTVFTMFYAFLFVGIVGGLILCVTMGQYTYQPLKMSSDYISSLYHLEKENNSHHDEIEQLFTAFEKLVNRNNLLNSSLKQKEEELEDFQKYRIQVMKEVDHGEEDSQAQRIDQAIAYIEKHYAEQDFSIGAVCEQFHFSPNRFSMEFKKQKGESPIQYVSNLRIEKMKHLLLTTNSPVNVLIEQVGYSDLSSFSKKFTKAVGTSPKKYREEFRKKNESTTDTEEILSQPDGSEKPTSGDN